MAEFFDPKEEVLDLQLTPYGEALMSIGQLKPVYYAFFDEDVLYDASGSAGITEAQNDIEPRIQENTPHTKVQAVYSGIESNLSPLIRDIRGHELEIDLTGDEIPDLFVSSADWRSPFSYEPIPPNIDQNYTFVEPLGTMQLGSQNAPAWNIKVLNGELSGANHYMTSSAAAGIYSNVRMIPQLEFDIEYRVLVGNTSEIDINGPISRQNRILSEVYDDGSFLYLSEDAPNLILVIDEENSSIDLEYDIEVFEVDPNITNDDAPLLRPLSFLKPTTKIVNGILLDREMPASNNLMDSTFAEYFFLVNTDREIPSEDICPVLEGIDARGITLNEIPYNCVDVEDVGRFDIYGTNAVEDPCDD